MRGYKNIKIEAFKKDVKSEKELINPLKNVIKEEPDKKSHITSKEQINKIICNLAMKIGQSELYVTKKIHFMVENMKKNKS